MVTKGFREMLLEADAATETIGAQEALDLLGKEDAVFVDVRESHERAQGFIPGSIHAPRGFLEFIAHPEGPMHNPVFTSGKRLILYCGSGTRSALAGKTLHDMGLSNLVNLAGGIQGWLRAGGDLES
jgi:rhodanese-related sulfurtransferase